MVFGEMRALDEPLGAASRGAGASTAKPSLPHLKVDSAPQTACFVMSKILACSTARFDFELVSCLEPVFWCRWLNLDYEANIVEGGRVRL